MKKIFGFGVLLATFAAASLSVSASPIGSTLMYSLTDDSACSGGCGTSPFGTITLTQTGADVVTVSVSLTNGYFVNTGGPHEAFAFSIAGDPAITMGTFSNSAFSTDTAFSTSSGYDYGLNGPDPSNHCCGTLSFVVTSASALSITSFGQNYEADIYSIATTNTGEVTGDGACIGGTVCGTSPTPEPISLALTGSGLVGLFFLRRRSTRS